MEAGAHAHILYTGNDAESREAEKKLKELSQRKKGFHYILVGVEEAKSAGIVPPYLLTDEGEFTNMRDIKWFIDQELKGYFSGARIRELPVRPAENMEEIDFTERLGRKRTLLRVNLTVSLILLIAGVAMVFWGFVDNMFLAFPGIAWVGFGFLHMWWIFKKLVELQRKEEMRVLSSILKKNE